MKYNVSRLLQFLKQLTPSLDTLVGRVITDSFSQPEKLLSLKEVTLEGIDIEDKLLHSLKQPSPISFTPPGTTTFLSFSQPLKQFQPIFVTVDGIFTEDNLAHPANFAIPSKAG